MGGDFLYKDLYEMAVAYWVGLACNHGFQNGNKRVALASCSTFLRMNGLKMELSENAALTMTVQLTTRVIDRETAAAILRENTSLSWDEE